MTQDDSDAALFTLSELWKSRWADVAVFDLRPPQENWRVWLLSMHPIRTAAAAPVSVWADETELNFSAGEGTECQIAVDRAATTLDELARTVVEQGYSEYYLGRWKVGNDLLGTVGISARFLRRHQWPPY